MAEPDPIRIGVMGCANIARRSVIPALLASPGLRLAGFASRSPAKGAEFAARFGGAFLGDYQALLDRADIDAVYMPLPTGLHAEWTAKALHAGRHVLVEKSPAATLPEAEALVALARQQRRVLMEDYRFEYHAQQAAVRQLAHEHLGELRLFRATFCFPPLDPGNFRYDPKLGGGALLDAGGYPLKACQVFVGSELQVLAATLTTNRNGLDLWGGALLAAPTENGILPLQIAFGFDQFYQCGIEMLGQNGRLTTTRTFTAGEGFTPTACLETPGRRLEIPLPADHHFRRILEVFCQRIRAGDHEICGIETLRQARLQHDVRRLAAPPGGIRHDS